MPAGCSLSSARKLRHDIEVKSITTHPFTDVIAPIYEAHASPDMTKRLHSNIDIEISTDLTYEQLCSDMTGVPTYETSISTRQELGAMSACVSFFYPRHRNDGPTIAAAGLQDPLKLQSLLQRAQLLRKHDYLHYVANQVLFPQKNSDRWVAPLLRAIERRRSGNIKLLLYKGADPNSIPIEHLEANSRRFKRYCKPHCLRLEWHRPHVTVEKESVCPVQDQVKSFDQSDLELRRATCHGAYERPDFLDPAGRCIH